MQQNSGDVQQTTTPLTDDEIKFKDFQKRAEQGNKEAQFEVALFYMNGTGVQKDEIKAIEWLEKAANQGFVRAQWRLSRYYACTGIQGDEKKAIEWLEKTAENGGGNAQYQLGYRYLKGDGVKKDEKKAFEWFVKSAACGISDGLYNLGICYLKGIGVEKDVKKAFDQFEKLEKTDGADQIDNQLKACYEDILQLDIDPKTLFKYHEKAAGELNPTAEYNLGLCFLYGKGTQKDEKEGIKWLEEAALHNNIDALKELGYYYLSGTGEKENGLKGSECLIKAQKLGKEKRGFGSTLLMM